MTMKISTREWETISAYIDGQLSVRERGRLEARLKISPELRKAVDEMRQTRALLRSQPKLRAPRNFTLTPEMVAASRRRSFVPAWSPALTLRMASAFAAILLVFVLIGDFFSAAPPVATSYNYPLSPAEQERMQNAPPGVGGEAAQPKMSAPQATPAPGEMQALEAAPAEPASPEAGSLQAQEAAPADSSARQASTDEPAGLQLEMAAPTPTPVAGAEIPAPAAGIAAQAEPGAEAQVETFSATEALPGSPESQSEGGRFSLDRSILRSIEIGLALLAILAAGLAFFIRRTGGG